MKPNTSSPASVLASQIQHLVTLHETLLVKEFRTRQALLDLAQKEQKALARGDYPALDDLQAGKQSTLESDLIYGDPGYFCRIHRHH